MTESRLRLSVVILGLALAASVLGGSYTFLNGKKPLRPTIGHLADSWVVYRTGIKPYPAPMRFRAYAFPAKYEAIVGAATHELATSRWVITVGSDSVWNGTNLVKVRTTRFTERIPNGRTVLVEENCNSPFESGGTIATEGSFHLGWVAVVTSEPTAGRKSKSSGKARKRTRIYATGKTCGTPFS